MPKGALRPAAGFPASRLRMLSGHRPQPAAQFRLQSKKRPQMENKICGQDLKGSVFEATAVLNSDDERCSEHEIPCQPFFFLLEYSIFLFFFEKITIMAITYTCGFSIRRVISLLPNLL